MADRRGRRGHPGGHRGSRDLRSAHPASIRRLYPRFQEPTHLRPAREPGQHRSGDDLFDAGLGDCPTSLPGPRDVQPIKLHDLLANPREELDGFHGSLQHHVPTANRGPLFERRSRQRVCDVVQSVPVDRHEPAPGIHLGPEFLSPRIEQPHRDPPRDPPDDHVHGDRALHLEILRANADPDRVHDADRPVVSSD